MKTGAMLSCVIVGMLTVDCTAETRFIGVRVSKSSKQPVKVAIHSDVAGEKRKNLSVKDAVSILTKAQGWGSVVLVGVEVRGASLREYLPVLNAIGKNPWMELSFLDTGGKNHFTAKVRKWLRDEK